MSVRAHSSARSTLWLPQPIEPWRRISCPVHQGSRQKCCEQPPVVNPMTQRYRLVRSLQLLEGGLDNTLRREPEFLLQDLQGRRRSEGRHADDGPASANVMGPTECRSLFDRYTGHHCRWQHVVAIPLVLLLEQLPGGHAHNPRLNALGLQLLIRGDTERNFTAGSDQ